MGRRLVLRLSGRRRLRPQPRVFGPPTPGSLADRGVPGREGRRPPRLWWGLSGASQVRPRPVCSEGASSPLWSRPRGHPRTADRVSRTRPCLSFLTCAATGPPPRTSRERAQLAPLSPARLLRGRAPEGYPAKPSPALGIQGVSPSPALLGACATVPLPCDQPLSSGRISDSTAPSLFRRCPAPYGRSPGSAAVPLLR